MQVKIFAREDIPGLEEDINEWLGKVNITVYFIKQSQDAGSCSKGRSGMVTVSIWYRNKR